MATKGVNPFANFAKFGKDAGKKDGVDAKKEGKVKKMATGGLAGGHKSADGVVSKGKTKGKSISMRGGK